MDVDAALSAQCPNASDMMKKDMCQGREILLLQGRCTSQDGGSEKEHIKERRGQEISMIDGASDQ